MKFGFTGTRTGMTPPQRRAVAEIMAQGISEFHHGDCIGADAEAHALALELGVRVVLHPPSDPSRRAFCSGAAEVRETLPYLDRNRAIVDESERLIATPAEFIEQQRSGTWYTVRYARRCSKPVVIIFPDGSTRESGPAIAS